MGTGEISLCKWLQCAYNVSKYIKVVFNVLITCHSLLANLANTTSNIVCDQAFTGLIWLPPTIGTASPIHNTRTIKAFLMTESLQRASSDHSNITISKTSLIWKCCKFKHVHLKEFHDKKTPQQFLGIPKP